jgi:hypothetical protein
MAKQHDFTDDMNEGAPETLGAPVNGGTPLDVFTEAAAKLQGGDDKTADPSSALLPSPESIAPTTPSEPEPETAVEPTETVSTPILDAYRSRGIDLEGYETDADFVAQLERQALDGMDAAERLRDPAYQEWQEQRQAPPEPEPEPEEETPGPFADWTPPEVSDEWEALVARGDIEYDAEAGRFVAARDWVDQSIADKITTARRWEADHARKLVREFPTLVEQATQRLVEQQVGDFDERVQSQIKDYFGQQQQLSESDQQYNGFLHHYREQLFALDADGGYQLQGDGAAKVSEEGQQFLAVREQGRAFFEKYNIEADDNALNDYAMEHWRPAAPSPSETATSGEETPQPTAPTSPELPKHRNERLKEGFAKEKNRINGQPDTPPTNRRVAAAAERAAEDMDFAEMVDEESKKQGII